MDIAFVVSVVAINFCKKFMPSETFDAISRGSKNLALGSLDVIDASGLAPTLAQQPHGSKARF